MDVSFLGFGNKSGFPWNLQNRVISSNN